ncbi:MAG: RNA polymerase sigma-70 factor [Acidimicrobiales bacterium]
MSRAPADEAVFLELRPLLLGVAYRMLGSAVEAEDVVQDAFVRWVAAPRHDVAVPRAYLTTMVTRLSIDRLRSAEHQRTTYHGPWLPEPVVVDEDGRAQDPAAGAELADTLSLAFLVLLEELGPVERATFLLREVFGYDYDEVAEMTGESQANCRQLVSRAKRRIAERRHRFDADARHSEELARRFQLACGTGDVGGLMALLSDDVVIWTDGGGKARAAPRPVVGPWRAARFLVHIAKGISAGAEVRPVRLNGQPGLVVDQGGVVVAALVLDVLGGQVCGVRIVSNPEKLTAVQPGVGRFPALP